MQESRVPPEAGEAWQLPSGSGGSACHSSMVAVSENCHQVAVLLLAVRVG